jgi:serine/threonine-protein kinase HipA
MRKAKVFFQSFFAGILEERERGRAYVFYYDDHYVGPPVSLTLPRGPLHEFDSLPAFFEGLLPEGAQLEALLRENKTDRGDLFSQLLAVGQDMVGAVTVVEDIE